MPFLALFFVLSSLLAPLLPGQLHPSPRDIDVLHYRFELTLSDKSNEIRGRAQITVGFLREGSKAFALDLVGRRPGSETGMDVQGVTRDGRPVAYTHQENRLMISDPRTVEVGSEATYQIDYRGIPEDGLVIGVNTYGDRTFFGDNWPNRARFWLPTVDHPSDKATVEWIVTAPGHYRVVGTGSLVEETDLGDGNTLTHWASEVPVSTKVMVMGAARFAVRETGRVGSVPIQAWVYPQDSLAGFHDLARAEAAVRFFESKVGPFPYAKLANVQSTTRYGGMENASNIFYAERAIRGDGQNEGLIVHETAHQWFGDSVTESDWIHLWLSEGFATYFTHLYDEATYGRESLVEGMLRDRRTVIRFSKERPELALVPQGMTDPNEMLNENAYQKGSWLLHMLRRQVGDSTFWAGIQRYFQSYRDRNATTEDFKEVMEEASNQDLDWFFQQWAHTPGHPVLAIRWSYDKDQAELHLQIDQTQAGGVVFRFPLEIGVVSRGSEGVKVTTHEIDSRETTLTIPVQDPPESVILDPNCWLLFEASG